MASRKNPTLRPADLVAASDAQNILRSPWMGCYWLSATCLLFTAVAIVIYSNSFFVPFVFDDYGSIVENSTIRDLTNWREVLAAPPRAGTTTDGRPILNLSLAINYAISGLKPWSYHLFNVLLHVLNACILQSLLRRLFQLPACPFWVREQAAWLALGTALLWLVHPLQTSAVTYVIQRAESLMAMFYLLTLYCFVRMATSSRPMYWAIATVAICWLGQMTKEVMATAPLAVLALDAALISGTLRQAIQGRRRFYLGLFSAWIGTLLLVWHTGGRSGTVSATGTLSPPNYFVAQCGFLLQYLRLSIWPAGQVLDYGMELPPADVSQWPAVLTIVALLCIIAWLAWRHPRLGVIGLIPVLILAPTSSFLPIVTQVAAEHRMYLPLAAVATLVVLSLLWVLTRFFPQDPPRQRIALIVACASFAVGLGTATYLRNGVFATNRSVWEDTVSKRPYNIRARLALANELIRNKQFVDIPKLFEPAVDPSWNRSAALRGRSRAWLIAGDISASIADLQAAIRLDPTNDLAYGDLAVVYGQQKNWPKMLQMEDKAIELNPEAGMYRMNRAVALANLGREDEARAAHQEAIDVQPYVADSHALFGSYWYARGNLAEAIPHFQRAIYYKADYGDAQYWLSAAYLKQGNLVDAFVTTSELLTHEDAPRGWEMLASIYEAGGDIRGASRTLEEASHRHSQSAGIHLRLGQLLGKQGDWAAALPEFQRAAELAPKSADTLANYAAALVAAGKRQEAMEYATRAIEIDFEQALARQVIERLQAEGD